jgi:DNA-directed RNA polymerase beta subunit
VTNESSDEFDMGVCEKRGVMKVPYASKLLFQELQVMNIVPPAYREFKKKP